MIRYKGMNTINRLLAITIVFLIGVLTGSTLFTKSEVSSYQEQYIIMEGLRTSVQESFLRFYTEEYCKELTVSDVVVNSFNIILDGLYCGKDTILILDKKLPIMFIMDETNIK